jgi:hypothetical protein
MALSLVLGLGFLFASGAAPEDEGEADVRMSFLGGEKRGAPLAEEVDLSMTCAEVEEYAGFALVYAPRAVLSEYRIVCYIEGYAHNGRPPDLTNQSKLGPELRENWEVHVLYVPEEVAIAETARYEDYLDAGSVDLAMVPTADIRPVDENAADVRRARARGTVRTRAVGDRGRALVQRIREDRLSAVVPMPRSRGEGLVLHVRGRLNDSLLDSILDGLTIE